MRRKLGVVLAKNHPVETDVVIAQKDSSNTSTLGFSQDPGIPFELGFIRNHYVGGTFNQPDQPKRGGDVRIAFNSVKGVPWGKRVAAVDDSIVRDLTMKKLVYMLKHAGADYVHLRICSPPVRNSYFDGCHPVPPSTTPQKSILGNGSTQN